MPPITSGAAYHKRNLAWPMSRPANGMGQVALIKRYETAIYRLLLTPKGSYFSDPNYGSMIYTLRTQGMNTIRVQRVLEDFRAAAGRYIPDINIVDLTGDMRHEDQKLIVSCFWVIRNASQQMHGDLASTNVVKLPL
jgi:phage baseplate assembly protein W